MSTSDDLDQLVDAVCREATDVKGDVRRVVERQADRLAPLLAPESRERVIRRAVARLDGLDAIEEFLDDREVDEVMVNRGREVWLDRAGELQHVADLPPGAVDVVLERALAPAGKRLDRTHPIVDLRLTDGARLCAVVAPIAVDGTTISIRRHTSRRLPLAEFATPSVCDLLERIIRSRANVLVAGATSSGKTTLLTALIGVTDHTDRLVAIEDTTELDLGDRHAVRLEARAAGPEGGTTVDVAHLVRAALRLRPDRLVVGEFRGDEVLAAVQALNTGHDGSLSTCHANSALDALHRVETLVMQAAPGWPLDAIRRQVSRCLDVVIHVRREPDGSRVVDEIVEVVETDGPPTVRTLAERDRVVGELSRGRR